MKKEIQPELLTPKEMAEVLRVSVRTLCDYIDEYELPYFRFGKKGKRFNKAEVLEKLKTHGTKPEIKVRSRSRIQPDIPQKETDRFRKLLGLY